MPFRLELPQGWARCGFGVPDQFNARDGDCIVVAEAGQSASF
jgi:hypothetical protein